MKPGPIIAMVALIVLGVWLVAGPSVMRMHADATPGAQVSTIDIGARKIRYERLADDTGAVRLRLLAPEPTWRADPMSPDEFWAEIGRIEATTARQHPVLQALNISSWTNLVWIGVGFGGQAAFFGRMLLQWVTSERKRESVVPAAFWWLSLLGAVALFSYFVWRRDIVGVLGQSTGVVIYARNLRLIAKAKRRARRTAAAAAQPPEPPADVDADPAPEPALADGAARSS